MSRYSDDALVLSLVRQARSVLDRLGLPDTFDLAQLRERIERVRGRPIHLIPHALPSLGPHGLWVRGETDDYVFYEEAAPPLRRLQIIGHEFGHMVYEDEGGPVQLAAPLPEMDLALPVSARGLTACTRTAYDDLVEQRCEWFGTVVVQRLR